MSAEAACCWGESSALGRVLDFLFTAFLLGAAFRAVAFFFATFRLAIFLVPEMAHDHASRSEAQNNLRQASQDTASSQTLDC